MYFILILGTKKLGKLITPEVIRNRNEILQSKSTRKVNANMLLEKYKNRFEYTNKCNICKAKTEGKHNKFCHTCAYTKGICEICGKKVIDVTMYKQSDV